MPDWAASPGCSCLVEAPVARNSSRPPAWLPAMPRALTACPRSRPVSRAAARAAARTPQAERGVDAALVERVRSRGGDTAHGLVADDRGEQHLLAGRADLLAGGQDRGQHAAVAWTRPPAWVSSKSRACTSVPVASAAAGADDPGPRPSRVASGGPPSPAATVTAASAAPSRAAAAAVPSPSSRCRDAAATTAAGTSARSSAQAQSTRPSAAVRGRRGHAGAHPKAPSDASAATVSASYPSRPHRSAVGVLVPQWRAAVRRPLACRPAPARRPAGRCRSAGARSRPRGHGPRCAARPGRPRRR